MSSAKDNPRIAQLFKLIDQQGADAFSTYALAMEFRKAGETTEAIHWLKKTLELDPAYLAVFYQLAGLYASINDNKNALTTYDQGIQLAEAKKELKTLAELKNARMNLELEL
jgi:Tfp pilus assembly protein PilF